MPSWPDWLADWNTPTRKPNLNLVSKPPGDNSYLIAAGGNAEEDTESNAAILKYALAQLPAQGLHPVAVSRIWRTPAFPAGAGPDFANACLMVHSDLGPEAVLARLHAIEAAMGRQRLQRWGQRVIDLDLLAMGQAVLPDCALVSHWLDLPPERQRIEAPDRLILPHPRLHQRAFVLVPLAEVAPDWVHPLLGLSVAQMRDALDPAERAALRPM